MHKKNLEKNTYTSHAHRNREEESNAKQKMVYEQIGKDIHRTLADERFNIFLIIKENVMGTDTGTTNACSRARAHHLLPRAHTIFLGFVSHLLMTNTHAHFLQVLRSGR